MSIDFENKYCWQKEYQLKYYDMDFRQVLKPSVLMNFLQDMATVNAEMLGFGYSFTYPKNYAWFLIKYHMEFDEYPEKCDEVLIQTEARGISKVLAHRDFEIWSIDKKKRYGRIISNWVMIDIKDKSILPLGKVVDFMPNIDKRDDDLSFEKVKAPTRVDIEKTFEIRYDDIDINQHVNNTNYIIWAFEPLSWKFKSENKLKVLDIVYKKEIKYGKHVVSQVQINDSTTTHILKDSNTQEELCQIKAVWEKNV